MSRYDLTSHWHVDAPIDEVWRALIDIANWPRWWSYVLEVEELVPGDASGLESVHKLTWGTAFPYLLSFTIRRTVLQPPHLIEAIFEGDLNGVGRWTLTPQGSATEVRYDWEVSTAGAWMNVMSPLLGPMFRWNHGLVMADGARGLSRYLASH